MTVLNDKEIYDLCSGTANPMLDPFVQHKEKMGSVSYGLGHFGYDIRISGNIRRLIHRTVSPARADIVGWQPNDVQYDERSLADCPILGPGDFVLVGTLEYFRMPFDVVGLVKDKSTLARLGLAVQNTVLEPGWEGYLTIEISNHGPLFIQLEDLMPIAQVLFFRGNEPLTTYEGRYQGQGRGVGAINHE